MDNDFLKIAKENGKIREIKEAFDYYPVEEEWHEGKVENVLKVQEDSQEYYIYIGDIYKIDNRQILFKVGEVTKEKVKEYKEAFYKNLK